MTDEIQLYTTRIWIAFDDPAYPPLYLARQPNALNLRLRWDANPANCALFTQAEAEEIFVGFRDHRRPYAQVLDEAILYRPTYSHSTLTVEHLATGHQNQQRF